MGGTYERLLRLASPKPRSTRPSKERISTQPQQSATSAQSSALRVDSSGAVPTPKPLEDSALYYGRIDGGEGSSLPYEAHERRRSGALNVLLLVAVMVPLAPMPWVGYVGGEDLGDYIIVTYLYLSGTILLSAI